MAVLRNVRPPKIDPLHCTGRRKSISLDVSMVWDMFTVFLCHINLGIAWEESRRYKIAKGIPMLCSCIKFWYINVTKTQLKIYRLTCTTCLRFSRVGYREEINDKVIWWFSEGRYFKAQLRGSVCVDYWRKGRRKTLIVFFCCCCFLFFFVFCFCFLFFHWSYRGVS